MLIIHKMVQWLMMSLIVTPAWLATPLALAAQFGTSTRIYSRHLLLVPFTSISIVASVPQPFWCDVGSGRIGGPYQGTDTPIPVPVPVPDLPGGRGRSPVPVPDLSGDGDAPPSPSPIC